MTSKELREISKTTPIIDLGGVKVSRLVWWLADMTNHCCLASHKFEEPEIGDWVIEITHVLGFARAKVGKLDAIGKLIKVEPFEGRSMKKYTLLNLEGKEVTWENAVFRKLEIH